MSKSRRVMFIGKTGSGKSTLIRALQGGEFSEQPKHSSSLVFDYSVNIDYPVGICDTADLETHASELAKELVKQTDVCIVIDGSVAEDDMTQQFVVFDNFYCTYLKENKHASAISIVVTKSDLNATAGLSPNEIYALKELYGAEAQLFFVSAKNESADLIKLRDYLLTKPENKFEKLKTTIVAILESYILRLPLVPTWGLRMFNHRHNERAIEIQESIKTNAKSFADIYLILKSQKALFDHEDAVTVPESLVANTEITTRLVNQPANSLDSGYYNKIMECINHITNLEPGLKTLPATVNQRVVNGM